MSATIEAPRGLDTLTPDEQKLMESMRDDAPASEPVAPPAAPAAEVPNDIEIEVPEAPEATPAARQDMVPQKALHAERMKRKEEEKLRLAAEKVAADLRAEQAQERAVLAARLDMIAKVAETQPAPVVSAPVAEAVEEPLPDKTTDPIGYFEALDARRVKQNAEQAKQIEALTGIVRGSQEQQQQARVDAEFRNWGVNQELAFEATEPAYREAMAFLKKDRHEELEAIGVTDPAERERIIGGDVRMIFQRGKADGKNPAERLFAAAQKRGYVKPAPKVADPVIPPLDDETTPAPADRAARIAEGRENSTTIGSVGVAPATRLSVEKIANMSEKDFEVFIKRYEGNPDALRDLMGH